MKACLRIVNRICKELRSGGVSEAELRQAISRTTASMILASERPSHRMFAIGESWLALGRYEPLDEVLTAFRQTTIDDVNKVLQTLGLEANVEVQVHPE